MYPFQLQHLITVCDSSENLCPDRDLIFLEDVLGTVATPNSAGTVPDITNPILLCTSRPRILDFSSCACYRIGSYLDRMKRLGTLWSLKVDQMTHAEVVTFLQEHGKQIDNQIYFYKMS